MTLAEFAEREASEMRATLARLPYGTQRAARLGALLSAYDRRPPCPLTPVVLDLVSGITGVDVDCGWHMVALGYQIKARRIIGDKEYGSDKFLSVLAVAGAHAIPIWVHETIGIIDDARRHAGLGPLTPGQTGQVGRCVGEQARMQATEQEAITP